jgi:outer membrane protein assembly factor BamB
VSPDGRKRIRVAAGALGVVGAVVAILAVSGVFTGGDDDDDEPPAAAEPFPREPPEDGAAPAAGGRRQPRVATLPVGGRPTAVAAGQGGVWVADSFSRRATVLESEARQAEPKRFSLAGPASDVTVGESGAWYALPEQQAVEGRELGDPEAPGETIGVEGFPAAVAAADGTVYGLSERSVELIDPDSGEVADRFDIEGFASSLAVGDGFVWVVKDNREVVRVDAASGEIEEDPVEVPEAFGVATGEGAVWVVSASGEVTRIDPGSLQATTPRARIRGALDVAAGLGSVWVTSSDRRLTRLDPDTLEPAGKPIPVGDEAASVSVGAEAVWVANGGDGTLTRIQP